MKEFDQFTDSNSMKQNLPQWLPWLEGNVQLTDCRSLHLHYKTYLKTGSRWKSFLAATYELRLHNRLTDERSRQIIFAKIFLGNRSREAFEQAIRLPLTPTGFGPSLIHLDDQRMLVWAFPNDPVLHHLPDITDPVRVKKHLPYASLPPGFAAKEISAINVKVINYRPELRCTARYNLVGKTSALTIYGKSFADDRGAEIYRRLESMWQLSQQSGGDFPMPRPLGYNDETQTIWQEELPGQPLAEIINRDNCAALISEAVGRLAFIHRSGAPTSARVTAENHMEEIRKKIAKLVQAFPAVKTSLSKTAELLERRLPKLPAAEGCVIHGDFHLRQLIVDDDQVALFDFDEFAIGDPAQDLANFIADLHAQPFDKDFVAAMSAKLVESYCDCAGWPADADWLNWHLAVQFITRAYRAYLQQKPNLENQTAAAATLIECSGTTEVSVDGRTHRKGTKDQRVKESEKKRLFLSTNRL